MAIRNRWCVACLLTGAMLAGSAWCGSGAVGSEPADQLPEPPPGQTWTQIWGETFEGDALDLSKWEVFPPYEHPRKGGWWGPGGASLDGKGHLAIETRKRGDRYFGCCVRTRRRFEHTHGYYVARVRFHDQPGHWPAFWLLHASAYVPGPDRDRVEIDVMEKPWLSDKFQHAIHWNYAGQPNQSDHEFRHAPGIMTGWHTFAVWWTPTECIFYVDGKETWRVDVSKMPVVPMYIKLTDEVGEWGGDITEAVLPDRFLVDYVRVYDLVDKKQE